jgi:hypothetical protein
VKHATAPALDRLEPLLARLRRFDGLKEKARGVFYFRSKAVLHFHEDPAGLFADFRSTGDWQRSSVDTKVARDELLRDVTAFIESHGSASGARTNVQDVP